MDKMTHAKVNLNNLAMGLSVALDKAILPNRYNCTYNSQRVTYIGLRLASYIKFEDKYLADIAVYGLLCRFELSQNHLEDIPFLKHSHIDTTTKEIFQLALLIEENLKIQSNVVINIDEIQELINNTNVTKEIKEYFNDLSEDRLFWLDLTNILQLPNLIYNFLQDFTVEMEYTTLIRFTSLIHTIVNNPKTHFQATRFI